jgi:hypothetical protein
VILKDLNIYRGQLNQSRKQAAISQLKYGKIPFKQRYNQAMIESQRSYLESLVKVEIYNIADYSTVNLSTKLKSLKASSILFSKLNEIIFLDADSLVIADPTIFFNSTGYLETGTLFWKGFSKLQYDNPIYQVMGLNCVDEIEQDARQLVVNKSVFGISKALALSIFIQENAKVYHKLLQNLDDSFRIAWRALRIPYHMIHPLNGMIGTMNNDSFCGIYSAIFGPFWSEITYGKSPSGYRNTLENPEIIIIRDIPLSSSYNNVID